MNGTLSLFIAARGHFKWVQMDSFGMVICFHAGRSPSPIKQAGPINDEKGNDFTLSHGVCNSKQPNPLVSRQLG